MNHNLCRPAALALTLLAACGQATAQDPAAAPVGLIDKPRLSEEIEALPRLAGDGPAVVRINAELDRMDAAAIENATACAADAGDGPGGGWSRTITQPMTGPAYVTLREHLETYCGGPYPSTSQTAVTYDLAAGARIDWVAALPGLKLTLNTFDDMPVDYVPTVASPALGAWYSRTILAGAGADAEWLEECRDVFDPEILAEQSFNIWADAEHGGVSVVPDFPHAIQACAETATLTPADLRALNAAPALVSAIETAHAAGGWAPKE